jgi:hypothetical protein
MQVAQQLLRRLQKVPWRGLPFTFKWTEYRTLPLDSQLSQDRAELHLESDIAAFRVFALARCLRTLRCVGTCGAAMLLADGGLTVAAGMFTFFRGGHKRSS